MQWGNWHHKLDSMQSVRDKHERQQLCRVWRWLHLGLLLCGCLQQPWDQLSSRKGWRRPGNGLLKQTGQRVKYRFNVRTMRLKAMQAAMLMLAHGPYMLLLTEKVQDDAVIACLTRQWSSVVYATFVVSPQLSYKLGWCGANSQAQNSLPVKTNEGE